MMIQKIKEIQGKYWPPSYQTDDEYNFDQLAKHLSELFELELGLRVERLFQEAKKELADLRNQLQRCNNERIMEKARADAFVDDLGICQGTTSEDTPESD